MMLLLPEFLKSSIHRYKKVKVQKRSKGVLLKYVDRLDNDGEENHTADVFTHGSCLGRGRWRL